MAKKQGNRYDENLVGEVVEELKLARKIAEAIDPKRPPAPAEIVLQVFDLLDTEDDLEGADLLTDLKKAQEVAKNGLGFEAEHEVPYAIVLSVFEILFLGPES
jgi:hypothetical protein